MTALPTPTVRRTVIVTDYLPTEVDRQVHGVYQRQRRHVQALQSLGPVDMIFLWPRGFGSRGPEIERGLDLLRRRWDLAGRLEILESRFTGQADLLRLLLPAAFPGLFAGTSTAQDADTSRAIRALLSEIKPDLVFAFRIGAALPVLRAGSNAPVMVDFDDIEHLRLRRDARLASGVETIRLRAASALMCRLEGYVARRAALCLVASAGDEKYLVSRFPQARVSVLSNAAFSAGVQPPSAEPTALLVGMARYRPNAEGAVWLARKVWPLVKLALPAARLLVAGEGSEELGIADADRGIETLGFVPNLLPLYRNARIALCPVRTGGGTRIKIIEAAMAGRACVATAIGAEGLAFDDRRHIRIADRPEDFAAACIELLGNSSLARSLGEAAANVAGRLYSETSQISGLVEMARRVIAGDAAVGRIRPAGSLS